MSVHDLAMGLLELLVFTIGCRCVAAERSAVT